MHDLFLGSNTEHVYGGKFPRCERNGVDQGMHNVLVHMKAVQNLHVHAETDGFIVNLQVNAT